MEKMLKDLPKLEQEKLLRGLRLVVSKGGVLTENKQTGYGYGQPGTAYTPEPTPDGTKLVFSWGEKKFYGSARDKVNPFDVNTAFIIDLTNTGWPAGGPRTKKIGIGGFGVDGAQLTALEEFLTYNYTLPNPRPHLKIEWADYQALGANTDFWEYLVQMLPDGKIIVNCQGGKGRTGTALSAIWMAINRVVGTFVDSGEAVALVRKNHCPGAVESKAQADYLNALAEEWAADLGVQLDREEKK